MEKLRHVVSPEDPNLLYSKVKKIGQGASGSVYVAKAHANQQLVAIKAMDLAHQPRKELIINEILVMKESQHPNIVNFLNAFLVRDNDLWVVMEYMEGGALTDVIDNNTLEEDQIAAVCLETCKGLEHLHNHSIIHRDIKPGYVGRRTLTQQYHDRRRRRHGHPDGLWQHGQGARADPQPARRARRTRPGGGALEHAVSRAGAL